jgi:3-oxoadipate enol-lactonase
VPRARIGDLDVHYEVAGSGPPLLFIGGSGGDLRARPNVLDGPLVRSFTVATYDQRGLGQSTGPGGPSPMAAYGADAFGLLEVLGWTKAHVVGVSFGGMVAQHLAIDHPVAVDRLVLCCTSSGGAGGASYPLHELHDLPPDERRRRQLAVSDTRFDAAWQAANPDAAADLLRRMETTDAATEQRLAETPGLAEGVRRQLEDRRGHDTFDRLGRITAPTLVAAGRYDGIAPVANSEALVAAIPDARLRVFEGGHLFLLQDRSAWPAITSFLLGSPDA